MITSVSLVRMDISTFAVLLQAFFHFPLTVKSSECSRGGRACCPLPLAVVAEVDSCISDLLCTAAVTALSLAIP